MFHKINLFPKLALLFMLSLGGYHSMTAQVIDKFWKQKNDRGNRYEGGVIFEVSEQPLELVALYSDFEAYTFGEKQHLKVHFYLPDTLPVWLGAQEMRVEEKYWMEAKQPFLTKRHWNIFDDWKVDKVLKPLNVPSENLGILIKQKDKEQLFFPAIIFHTNFPKTLNPYIAYFRPGKNFRKINVKVYRGQFLETTPTKDQLVFKNRLGEQPGGMPFKIEIDPTNFSSPLEKDWKGWLTVQLIGRVMGNTDKEIYTFSFYHHPNLKK